MCHIRNRKTWVFVLHRWFQGETLPGPMYERSHFSWPGSLQHPRKSPLGRSGFSLAHCNFYSLFPKWQKDPGSFIILIFIFYFFALYLSSNLNETHQDALPSFQWKRGMPRQTGCQREWLLKHRTVFCLKSLEPPLWAPRRYGHVLSAVSIFIYVNEGKYFIFIMGKPNQTFSSQTAYIMNHLLSLFLENRVSSPG